jgi:serine/threonine protein kinase
LKKQIIALAPQGVHIEFPTLYTSLPTEIRNESIFVSRDRRRMGCTTSTNNPSKRTKKSHPQPITFEPKEIDPIKLIGRLDVPILMGTDYKIENYVASGGEGRVYAATYLPENKAVALKFFGYEAKTPDLDSILNEIRIMKDLSGIDGVVQFHGIFMDTVTGVQAGKKYRKPFPVIVMEILSGGELFDRIQIRSEMTEQILANLFRNVVETMQQMHNRCYIHRFFSFHLKIYLL